MADVYSSTANLGNLVTAAYDRYLRLALRSMPQFRQFADSKPVQQTHPGSSVIFSFYSDLAEATSTIDEVTDPDIVQIPDPTRVTVTLGEYGNYTVLTKRLEEFSLDGAIDSNAANIIAYNLATSVDSVVRAKLDAGTQVISEEGGSLVSTGNAVNSIVQTDTLKSRDVRFAVTKLRGDNTVPTRGELFTTVLHPNVAHDLRVETGSTGWRTPHEYVDTSNLWAAEIGTYEGSAFVESPRCAVNANTGPVNVYNTYVMAKEALAEAVAVEPHVVAGGTIADPLQRKMALGWHGILGHALFRPESLWVVKTASSIDA